MNNTEKFKKFMQNRFIAWEVARGEKGTVTDFATAIDVYQGDVSHWMKGTRVPGIKVLQKIAASKWIGPEVWEAAGFGYLVKDPVLLRTLAALESLPRPLQESFAEEAEHRAEEYGEKGQTSLTLQSA